MMEWAFWAAGTALIVLVSWKSLRFPVSHGLPRFFAFEALLILATLRLEKWFADPFAVRQIISWVLLCGSAVLAAHGFYLLKTQGVPEGPFENTTRLVRRGAYRFIRHPLYSSLILLGLGTLLKRADLTGSLLCAFAILCLVATARIEEAENRRHFGEAYTLYCSETRMFIPFLV